MKSADIRQRFLDYFKRNGHEVVASSSLVPASDPTLLFTNAGMVQFKDTFLGLEKRNYKRATSSQRCVRAGGKHNDLENVGYTARHHTFFEMLGNFSFGDYFKREAIQYAWQFLTEDLKLPPEKLWVTVYKDDDEAADIWLKELGVDEKRFSRLGEKDNFWSMGDTGPCGPCSEIFYDHGEDIEGGPPGTAEEDGDRYVEIWNLVFMQYNRDDQGALTPLPKPSVDTGMGLERVAAVMQGVHTNYDIDLFQGLVKAAAEVINVKDLKSKSLNVIADHIRAASFLITDGVYPSNEGRGYVLRRIIRRAIRHGFQLGAKGVFFYKMVKPLVKEMGQAYPELKNAQKNVEQALKEEEERFAETIEHGMKILEQAISDAKGKTLSGDTVFQLYDTYGFPSDLTADVCRERGLNVDMKRFDEAMDQQRQRARAASGFKSAVVVDLEAHGSETDFNGYDDIRGQARVTGIHNKDGEAKELKQGEEGVIFLDKTPFYAESGGQVGDRGILQSKGIVFDVMDTQKGYAHVGTMTKGSIKKGDKVEALVNGDLRQATALNHSATHLMHAALRTVLGDHVAQKGSLVNAQYTRFDFSHTKPLSAEEIQKIEDLVNTEIRANNEVAVQHMAYKAAVQAGAMALFGEKYGDEVRVVGMGDFSTELCGGTHVTRTGDIGFFKIISEGGVAAGVRRVVAVTGGEAARYMRDTEASLNQIAGIVKGSRDDVADRVEQLNEKTRQLEKELAKLRKQLSTGTGGDLADQARVIKGAKVLAARIEGADAKSLRETLDHLKDKLQHAAVVLAAVEGKKVSLVAGVTKELSKQLKAGDLVNSVASQIGGKGGGRPDMAQAGGQLQSEDTTQLDQALEQVPDWVADQL